MTNSRLARSVAGICGLALSLALVVGCTSAAEEGASPPATPSSTDSDPSVLSTGEMRSRLAAVDDLLTCDRRLEMVDDMYFWDRAVGVTCNRQGQEPTVVEIFQHPGSVDASLSEWAINESTPALVASHTAVVGPPEVLDEIRRRHPSLDVVLTSPPQPERGLTLEQQRITDCLGYVASHLSAAAAGTPEPESDVTQLDATFPGYRALVGRLDRSPLAKDLKGLESADPQAFEAKMTKLAPTSKQACAQAASKMR